MYLMILILLAALAAAGLYVAVRVVKSKQLALKRAAALDNPGEKLCLQALLPPDATNSNLKMTRFWSRLCDLLPADEQALAQGRDCVSCALVGQGRGTGRAAVVRMLVWCPAELANLVESTLQDAYEGELQINHLQPDEDPLGSWASSELLWRASQQPTEAETAEPTGASSSLRQMRGLFGDDD
jgi:hypothetical protein